MKRRFFSTALALSSMACAMASSMALPVWAQSPPSGRIGSLMQISVVDRGTGAELPVYRHRGEYWVAGRPGTRYAIRARNAMGERVMAVMSVDGVNVVTGETAGIGQNGYVFGPRERSDISGWRKSDSQIAAFEFAAAGNSYASRTGRPDDVGVIGVAMFRERMPEPPMPPIPPVTPYPRRDDQGERERRSESSSMGDARAKAAPASPGDSSMAAESSASAASPAGSIARQPAPSQSPSLGTAHGRRETSYVGKTTFERAQSSPDEVVRIRYDSRENLVSAGVIPVSPPPRWPRPAGPSPFPGSEPGYVPDPPPRY